MGVIVTSGAICTCAFGTMPSDIQVTSQTTCLTEGKLIATIQDMKPNVNIKNFGMCSSMANPAVASATAAALGVLTPQPCTLVPLGTWVPTNPKIMAGGCPCLTSDATLMCGLGAGAIKITVPGQAKVLV